MTVADTGSGMDIDIIFTYMLVQAQIQADVEVQAQMWHVPDCSESAFCFNGAESGAGREVAIDSPLIPSV
jgi:hypothetical protein